MLSEEKLNRLNFLARKSKSTQLSEKEKKNRANLEKNT